MNLSTFIVVGGFGRAGTNSVVQYLHLHPKIFAFASGGEGEFDSIKFSTYLGFQIPQIARFGKSGEEFYIIKNIFEQKNKRYKEFPHGIHDYSFVARKHEMIECMPEGLRFIERMSNDIRTKFVFCVRESFEDLYLSRKENRQIESPDEFLLKCFDSFSAMRRIAGKYDSCCIDVTSKNAYYDYVGINEILNLEPSDWQIWWRKHNPKTNARPTQDLGERELYQTNPKIVKYYRKAFYEMRSKLI